MTLEELKKIARAEVDRLKSEIAKRDNELARKDQEIARLKKWNKWFFYRVKFMRQCQREYYRLHWMSRDKKLEEMQRDLAAEDARKMLAKSKELEREVDEEIRSINNSVSREDAIRQLKEHFGDLEEVELDKSMYLKGQSIETNNYWDPGKKEKG